MAFLDFIRNREASQQQSVAEKSQEQKPMNAKEMYSRQAQQDGASQKSMGQMPPDQQGKVEAIRTELQKATQHTQQNAPTQQAAPTDSAASPEPMRQNMVGQDKTTPALSPTSAQAGMTATKDAATKSNETPAKAPEKTPQHAPQTVPRRPPSWER
ncbi:MAG: hypothetical protein ABSD75_24480 [Terriglobales bacterium]|jgi:hypothetical protein